jgi:amino acid transporter
VNVKQILIGKPFPSSRALHERLDRFRGLAVFASDPISSNAYATEAIMSTLVLLGTSALAGTLPIALVIAMLVAFVIFSYNQTIYHYPMGGGAYMVTKDNLGRRPSLFAGAALLSDYVLTVAVSVSAGVRALGSAFPEVTFLHDNRAYLGIIVILIITWLNLRGVRESGTIFALPTYAFVTSVLLVIIIGLVRYYGFLGAPPLPAPQLVETTNEVSSFALVWLVLRSFAAGCTALTGIEAISDGVQAFREPAAHNAIRTMRTMGLLAMALFIGISFLATHLHLIPNERESILSQLARTITGGGPFYFFVQACTMLILVLAANTAYQDFPRLSAFLASDGFLPRWMTLLGDRLVYSRGIGVLALMSSLLIVIFDGDEIRLLPLYALGVFVSFTLSQAGMVVFWSKVADLKPGERLDTGVTTLHYEQHVFWKRLPSLIGGMLTGIVLVILAITKFLEGAWIIVLALPLMVLLFRSIRNHYDYVAKNLRLTGLKPENLRTHAEIAIVPIGDLHRGSLRAIRYAQRLSSDVRVVKVVGDEIEAAATRQRWEQWSHFTQHSKLVFLHTDYRDPLGPLVEYIRNVYCEEFAGQLITVVVPEFVPNTFLAHLLHNQTASLLRVMLRGEENVIVIDVPYHLRKQPQNP